MIRLLTRCGCERMAEMPDPCTPVVEVPMFTRPTGDPEAPAFTIRRFRRAPHKDQDGPATYFEVAEPPP